MSTDEQIANESEAPEIGVKRQGSASLGLRRQGSASSGFSIRSDTIVFDPNRQRLIKDRKSDVEQNKQQYIKVPLKGRNCIVDVVLEVGPAKRKVSLGEVDLSTLGTSVKWLRTCNQIDYLYVLGQIPINSW